MDAEPMHEQSAQQDQQRSQSGKQEAPEKVVTRVRAVIEALRPAVQADGGDIELVGVSEDGVVSVRMHGACVGCPSSDMTLTYGIERNLKDNVPQVAEVHAVE